MKLLRIFLSFCLSLIMTVNIYYLVTTDHVFTATQSLASNLSSGDNYYGRLRLWYLYAQNGDWTNAVRLEPKLDNADISYFKTNNQPQQLMQQLDLITAKTNKTADDWLEMARIQTLLGQKIAVINSLSQARSLDPVREDISRFYFEINR